MGICSFSAPFSAIVKIEVGSGSGIAGLLGALLDKRCVEDWFAMRWN